MRAATKTGPDPDPDPDPAAAQELVQVESLAQMGVQLLLFTLGLEFSLAKLRVVRNVALLGARRARARARRRASRPGLVRPSRLNARPPARDAML
jgi:hypothetical protein